MHAKLGKNPKQRTWHLLNIASRDLLSCSIDPLCIHQVPQVLHMQSPAETLALLTPDAMLL